MRKFLLAVCLVIFSCLFYSEVKAQVITVGAVTGTISSCVGSASFSPNIQQFTVKGSQLTGDVTVTAPANFEVSLNASDNYSNTLSIAETNGSVGNTIYVRTAASAPLGPVGGKVLLESPNASHITIGVDGKVNALPNVNTVANQTLNSGEATTAINFTGTGQVYSWTNDNPNIGLVANGTGDIASFKVVNNTTTSQTATIMVTPKPAGFIYTANFNGKSVTVINAGNNTVVATIPVEVNPASTILSLDGRYVYVPNFYSKTISVIDVTTNLVVASIPTGSGLGQPILSSDGSLLYVLNDLGNISIVNTATFKVTSTISVGKFSQRMIISPNGKYIYVTRYEGYISVVNTETGLLESNIAVTSTNGLGQILTSPDGSRLYVTDNFSNIFVINTDTRLKIATIPVGNQPFIITINSDGSRVYASNQGANTVSVISTATNTVITTITTGRYPVGTAITADGKYFYEVNRVAQTVSVINASINSVIKTISIPTEGLDSPVLSPDGSRVYITNDVTNSVYVINTATNTVIANIKTGVNPLLYPNGSISPGDGCSGAPVSFKITVKPPLPAINTVGVPNPVGTTYGTASVSASFTVSGTNLSAGILVTPPAGFEVSTDNVNFSPTLTIGNTGNIASTLVYMRLAATTNAATYSGNVVLSSPGVSDANVPIGNSIVKPAPLNITGTYAKIYGDVLTNTTVYYNTPNVTFTNPDLKNGNSFNSIDISFGTGSQATDGAGTYNNAVTLSGFTGRNGYLSSNYTISYSLVNLVVLPATLTITANDINKPYGTTLAGVANSGRFTASGLKNGETIGSVGINYGTGAEATATAGIYTGSVVAVNATGGTFAAGNYSIAYVPGNINVITPLPPDITTVGTPQPVSTTYGTASPSSSFTVSGANLSAGITVTPPAGFEVSTDGVHFSNTVTVGAAGTVAAVPVYIRLASATNAGAYSGDINLSSGSGSGTVTVPMPNSTVDKAPLTVFAIDKSKTYGDVLSGFTNSEDFAVTAGSLKNGNIITLVSVIYGQGGAATDPVGYYTGSVKIIAVTGANGYDEDNYIVTFMPADIAVKAAPLIVAAGNYSKTYGTVISEDQPNSFAVGGLKNNETIENVKSTYGLGRNATDPVGIYKGSIIPSDPSDGTFTASNYTITYKPGDIEVTPAILTVTADDKTKNYGAVNPTLTFTYSGFVNNETEAQLTEQPTVTTTATTKSDGGIYPITISGGSAVNYTFNYINATLTIIAPTVLVIPNTFTPNNDGINDSWKIPALASYPDCLVQIFNRYGSKVYSSVGYPVPWDGTYKGLKVPDGVYYYIIDTKVLPGKASGYVNLIR